MGARLERRRRSSARVRSPRTGTTVAAVVSLAPGGALLLRTDGPVPLTSGSRPSSATSSSVPPVRPRSPPSAAPIPVATFHRPHLDREPRDDCASAGQGARAPPGTEEDEALTGDVGGPTAGDRMMAGPGSADDFVLLVLQGAGCGGTTVPVCRSFPCPGDRPGAMRPRAGATERGIADAPPAPGRAHDGIGDGQAETGARSLGRSPGGTGRTVGGVPRAECRARCLPRPGSRRRPGPDDDADGAPWPGVATGVVHQDSGQAVDPLRWSADPRLGVTLADDR
jgi:hypothetical protein